MDTSAIYNHMEFILNTVAKLDQERKTSKDSIIEKDMKSKTSSDNNMDVLSY
jgi:hypothetical protein